MQIKDNDIVILKNDIEILEIELKNNKNKLKSRSIDISNKIDNDAIYIQNLIYDNNLFKNEIDLLLEKVKNMENKNDIIDTTSSTNLTQI